jgi:hypothetical protein
MVANIPKFKLLRLFPILTIYERRLTHTRARARLDGSDFGTQNILQLNDAMGRIKIKAQIMKNKNS